MEIMQLIFIVVVTTGLLYFLLRKRKFDFYSIAFLSACVYFLPGFVGYTLMPTKTSMEIPVDLENETYMVMIAVLVLILCGGVVFDFCRTREAISLRLKGTDRSAMWAVGIALMGYILLLGTAGEIILFDDKSTMMMEAVNRWYVVGSTAAPLGAVLSFVFRKRFLLGVSMALLLFDVYIGFRTSFAVAMIAIFVLWLGRHGTHRFAIRNWKIGFAGLIVAFFLFLYKQLFVVVKLGMWDFIVDRVQDPDLYITAIGMSEPFTTQVILNEVIVQRFEVGISHLKESLYQFALFSPELGVKPISFNDLFQPTLFATDMEYGMANNIWAEMWSSGGWPLLLAFIAAFVLILGIGSYLTRASDPTFAAGAAVCFSYWAFYIHRNDLAYQINLEKRVILVWAICVGLCEFSNWINTWARNSVSERNALKESSC
jgi:hypothetical protein